MRISVYIVHKYIIIVISITPVVNTKLCLLSIVIIIILVVVLVVLVVLVLLLQYYVCYYTNTD